LSRDALPPATEILCQDGVPLTGHLWPHHGEKSSGMVILNAATGVRASYYHPYARFLAAAGFDVLTYDYRGIGLSRPESLRGCSYRWRDWGEQDFEAALRFAHAHAPEVPLLVVGHSIGGFLPGFAPSAHLITRLLSIGGQYGHWRDYARPRRARLFLKWHVAMPLATSLFGYFPGRKFGWLEDLPAGVAHEWSFRRARLEQSHPPAERAGVRQRFASFHAPILAITATDDEFATQPALRRALAYYHNAPTAAVMLAPEDLGFAQIGHFGLLHARHRDGFWPATLRWLRAGENPWTDYVFALG
jgi:predicted alpha/beta hydrolase